MTARALVSTRPTACDVPRTFAIQRFGLYDPTASLARGVLRKAFASTHGACVVTVRRAKDAIEIEATGADEDDIAADMLEALATDDGYDSFSPAHPLLAKLHRTMPGLRLVRVPWRFDVAAVTILQQRVTVREALQQWRRIATRYGESVGDLRAFPSALTVAQMESWKLEELGVDPKRTRAMLVLARDVHRRDLFARGVDRERIRKTMLSLRGIGPWTTETVLGFGFGDPDALPLADLHLPHLVTWALAREKHGSDERMVELLEPVRGHRFRAVRLLLGAGITVPR